jgi:hypothetical protein
VVKNNDTVLTIDNKGLTHVFSNER